MEYELSPPVYDLFRSYFCKSFFIIITIGRKSLYLDWSSFILLVDYMASEAVETSTCYTCGTFYYYCYY